MGIHDEFLEIVRILVETPEPVGRKPPRAETGQASEAASESNANKKREGASS